MYEILNELLSDKKSDVTFNVFGIWHILYIVFVLGFITFLLLFFRKKDASTKNKLITTIVNLSFGLYMLDFFLMPIAYQSIDIEKLPFHICTISCVLCFLSRHNVFFKKFQMQFAVLGLIGNFIYLIYPAGVGWYQIHPLSYRVIQTLLYHGCMTSYGILTLAFERPKLTYKKTYKEFIIICCLVIWALIGNTIYNGTYKEYDHFFNWLFVVQDPFNIIPLEISKFIMPFFMTIFLYLMVILVYFIYHLFMKEMKRYGKEN